MNGFFPNGPARVLLDAGWNEAQQSFRSAQGFTELLGGTVGPCKSGFSPHLPCSRASLTRGCGGHTVCFEHSLWSTGDSGQLPRLPDTTVSERNTHEDRAGGRRTLLLQPITTKQPQFPPELCLGKL